MGEPIKGRSLAEQIHDALWLCVSPKRSALDSEMLELRESMKKIIKERNLEKFKEALELMGKGESTPDGQKLVEAFKTTLHLND
jgi:hypothetical protein